MTFMDVHRGTMTSFAIRDVRAAMPNYEDSRASRRDGAVTGIAIHHSATANDVTGLSMDDARSIFRHHVETLGWSHGGYHYLVHPNGMVEYALDEGTPGFHAGFTDPDDTRGLESGQYWNNHFLAVCLLGWFERNRTKPGSAMPLPNRFTSPTPVQWRATLALVADLARRYGLDAAAVRGHRELEGSRTFCPGANVDLHLLRTTLSHMLSGGARG